ncbi:acyl-CoA synthetase (AMP-forming)/AMP-acid ligase II [Saccharothrix ecbatanensis]|uniref:Acyl-CoA synthetase (AMP-forming)/AMP-acid ligase II n=1 Tax=Saccharothrix ecbatanensis TaxID=1105145 RepID=A0A7W9HDH2_9PSEU|nr:class I adenylate-forming enzyme family protein [Saccharothrix ecbatanensis]MBB5800268.1 acyl-CoA synthetase (AMP-forming)/AMP-acid ligase II [Saccharothrix ecbatanensis]
MTTHLDVTAGATDLAEFLSLACRAHGGRTALSDGRRTLTYAELDAAVAEGAAHLRAAADDGPVVVLMANRVDSVVRLFAAWSAGRCAVPLDASVPPPVVAKAAARTKATLLSLGDLATSRADLTSSGRTAPGGLVVLPAPDGARDPLLHGAALTLFTSGSTGQPKGVVLGHDNLLAKLPMLQEVLDYRPEEHAVALLRSSFSFCQWDLLLTLGTGGSMRLFERFSPEDVVTAFTAAPVARAAMVPTMLRRLLPLLDDRGVREALHDVGSPGKIIVGGELLTPELGKKYRRLLPHSGIAVIYGLTETSAPEFLLPADEYDAHSDSVGRALSGVRWHLGSPGRVPAAGDQGTLWVRSAGVLRGYLGDPELTRNAIGTGYFVTGDLVECLPEGRIAIRGRANTVIVKGANKIMPTEVEHALEENPGVATAITCGVPDPVLGERLHAVVVPTGTSTSTPDDLRQWLSERVERYKVPDAIHFLDEIPTGTTGKADRAWLTNWVRARALERKDS